MSRQTLISIFAIFLVHYGGTLDPEVERAFAKVHFQLNGLESKNDFLKSQNDFLKSKIASLEAKNHHQLDLNLRVLVRIAMIQTLKEEWTN